MGLCVTITPINFIDPSGLRYVSLRAYLDGWVGWDIGWDPTTKTASLDTGVTFFEGDGKGSFIGNDNRMYIWIDDSSGRDDTSIFFLPGNDTVKDEGWMITAAAVGGVIVVKGAALVATAATLSKAASTEGTGYATFDQFKKAVGSAGPGRVWHHIVEKSQIAKSGFDAFKIHNTNNLINISKQVHDKISGHYNTTKFPFTNGLSVRDWLAGQDFQTQYEYGLKVLRDFGVIE